MNTFVLVDTRGRATLVDAGLPHTTAALTAGLRAIGIGPEHVTRIVLTHAHLDHAGGAAMMLRLSSAGLSVHERDADYMRTGRPPRGDLTTTIGRLLDRFNLGRFPPVEEVTTFRHEELLDVAGGLRVYHTPGHTPGHVSLLAERSGVLITGDALFNLRSVSWPMRAACTDPDLNRRSADILGDLDYEVAAFTHGPEISQGAKSAVRAFLRGRTSDRTDRTARRNPSNGAR